MSNEIRINGIKKCYTRKKENQITIAIQSENNTITEIIINGEFRERRAKKNPYWELIEEIRKY